MKTAHSNNVGAGAHHLPPIMMLRAFERASARLSFKLAAQELSLTPSAVSHQVRGLERHFGVRLFARTGRSVVLTPAGENYLVSVQSALALLERGSRALTPVASKNREVRISALPFFISAVMLPRLGEFIAKFPNITLRLEATNQYADFEGSGVDLAVRMGHERAAGLHLDKLVNVRALPVCAPALASGKNGIKEAAGLARHTLIQVSQQPGMWRAWLEHAGLPELAPANEIWFDSVPLALQAAQAGLGVALGMQPLIANWPGFGRTLVAPLPPGGPAPLTYFAVCRPEQKDDPVILALRRWLLQCLRDLLSLPGDPSATAKGRIIKPH
jgi:LysR family transcriptional regulator, glycine cleavage system transcriptional activator